MNVEVLGRSRRKKYRLFFIKLNTKEVSFTGHSPEFTKTEWSAPNLMEICPKVAEKIHPGPKMSTNWWW